MKKQVIAIISAALILTTPMAMALDTAEGTVLAFDRKAKLLVFSDKTVWSLEEMNAPIPARLKTGHRVRIEYESDEDGVGNISSITILSERLPIASEVGVQDSLQGTVLALDRKAKTLVLTDKTIWSLAELAKSMPLALKAGDRVEIQYESDEDGVTSITSIKNLGK